VKLNEAIASSPYFLERGEAQPRPVGDVLISRLRSATYPGSLMGADERRSPIVRAILLLPRPAPRDHRGVGLANAAREAASGVGRLTPPAPGRAPPYWFDGGDRAWRCAGACGAYGARHGHRWPLSRLHETRVSGHRLRLPNANAAHSSSCCGSGQRTAGRPASAYPLPTHLDDRTCRRHAMAGLPSRTA
jgi:hypothetical protein